LAGIVTAELVATVVPEVLSILILTVNVSAPSTNKLVAIGTLNVPALLLTVKDPEVAPKSEELVVTLFIVQYKFVQFATFVVVTLNVPEAPSLIVDGTELKVTVAADMVTEALLATISPVIL